MNPLRIPRKVGKALFDRDARERYEARFSVLQELAQRWGFALYTFNLAWLEDDEFKRVWGSFPMRDVPTHDRKFILYSMAKTVAALEGDTAECGVLMGGSSYLICKAMGRPGRVHHAFDSFQGLSQPDDVDRPAGEHTFRWKKHDLSVPLETVKRNLAGLDVEYHQGWIPERFGDVADRKFAFVHVDVDLHQPTKDALEFFYERMVPGGVLLCDDYGSTACPGAKTAFDDLVASKPERSVVHLTSGQGFIIKR